MRTYQISILCHDVQYAAGLTLALNRESGGRIRATAVSSPETLNRLAAVRLPDLLLTEWPEETSLPVPVVLLSSQPSEEGIFMYQSVREIVREILRRVEVRAETAGPSGCIGVFSPLGRCGKTTLARGITASGMAGEALYIGMEDYCACGVHSEILYRIKERMPDIHEAAAEEIRMEGGIPCLYLAGMYPDYRDITSGDLQWFTEQMLQAGKYRTLVFDMGSCALAGPEELRAFDRIYMPVLQDSASEAKLESFRMNLAEMGLADLWRRMIRVEIPAELCRNPDAAGIMGCIPRW